MRSIYVRIKEFSWIFLNLLEFTWIYMQFYEFPDVLLSSSLHFRDIWETPDRRTDRRTDGRTDKASYRDAWTHLKTWIFISIQVFCIEKPGFSPWYERSHRYVNAITHSGRCIAQPIFSFASHFRAERVSTATPCTRSPETWSAVRPTRIKGS